ncbi:MAG: endolytic transglycosylase MltG [Clostridia bacterium]|nr:endolytic transglycosylase MltG [Oscillospiraceae bacterium]MBQ1955461.1 endolytic transglycosylase MltG [Clostridia bacterium]
MKQNSDKLKNENVSLPEGDFEESSVDLNTKYDTEKPKSKKTVDMGCFSALCYFMLIIGLSIIISAVAVFAVNDVFALVKADVTTVFTIVEEDGIDSISERLSDKGIIRYPKLFKLYAVLTENTENIAPGDYEISSSMDYRSILNEIQEVVSTKKTVTVMIPEGMEQDDIFELLEEEGVCEAWRLRAFAKYYDFGYSFLEGLPYTDNRLEGYLFPDTYIFYENDDPQRVLSRMLYNFRTRWDVDMKARLENISMDMSDIVIIASMIEKEAKFDDERTLISSVIHNRLRNDNYPHLQIDATVLYAIGERKEELTKEDLAFDSPYNTYVCEGLPAGPICNPGRAALYAALYPEETEYYYYVAQDNGYHLFAETYYEHQQNIDYIEAQKDMEQ